MYIITKLTHYDAFILFASANIVLHQKTAGHFLKKQSTMCAAFADAVSFLQRLLSGWSLFPWFLAFCFLFVGFMQPHVTDSFVSKPTICEDG